jgi:hypothetical protein
MNVPCNKTNLANRLRAVAHLCRFCGKPWMWQWLGAAHAGTRHHTNDAKDYLCL